MIVKGFKGGKGGGGSSGRTPVESPDDLRSRQYARIIDLICEGEVEGLATGDLRSVYLDKTPVQNDDGTTNFSGVTLVTRNGTQSQSYISGFPDVESEANVNIKVAYGSSVIRTISSSVYDAARVTIGIPSLYSTNLSNGDITGASVTFTIEVQPNGGSYTTYFSGAITGKTTTRYQRSYYVPLTGSPPWNIRVTRLTADSTSSYLQNDLYWDSFTQITHAKLRYPNSALAALVVDSQQFSAIPNRGYDMKLMRIQIPSNATVREDGSLTYSGIWDGTFQIAWSSNPAWVFYDMIVNGRYGLGQFISPDQVDKWSLYSIGQYCDELVVDGFGGYEPRFSCNLYIQEQKEAFQVIQNLASIFRGISYWASGSITASQDSPRDPSALFTNANVIDGLFTYSGSSAKARHTVALVAWNDPDDFYATKPEYVEDADGILRYGVIQTSVVAMGCTSRGQAHRVGKWLLYSEINETETVSFKAGLEAAVCRPNDVIQISDRNRAGVRRGGRVAAAATNSVTIDAAFSQSAGQTYTLFVTLPDGTVGSSVVSNIAGTVLTLATPLPDIPNVNSVWMVESQNLQAQLFRVVSVIDSNDGTVEISALSYNPDKFDFVENNIQLSETPISVLNSPPDTPTGVSISESLYQSGSNVKNIVAISWNQVDRADSYQVSYQVGENNPVTVTGLKSPIYEIQDAPVGVWKASVFAVSVNGKRSTAGTDTKEVYGKTAPPSDVQNFSLVGVSNGVAQLSWDMAPDLDVVIGGAIRIRHSPDVATPSWESAVDIGTALQGNTTSTSVPHIDGTYMAKFIDSSGNSSVNAVMIKTTTASLVNMNVVQTLNESGFTGTKTGVLYPSALGGLSLDYAGTVDEMSLIDSVALWDSFGAVGNSGEYLFSTTPDLGAVYVTRVTAALSVQGYDDLNSIDQRLDNIDTWPAFDGDVADDVNAAIYVRTTNDNPSGSPVWTSWRPFFVGQYEARGFQFKLLLTSASSAHNINVSSLVVTLDMPDRVEAQSNIASGTSAYSVTFPAAFKVTPAIGITAKNMQTGDYYTRSAESASGFTIQFFNAGGTPVSRNFDYIAKGYGVSG